MHRGLLKKCLFACTLIFTAAYVSACDAVEEPDVRIVPGAYEEFGERLVRDGTIISEGLAGVYFGRLFHFGGDGSFLVQVMSDLHEEEGSATGRFGIRGHELKINIESSSTSVYSVGSQIKYEKIEVVNHNYRTIFSIDDNQIEFTGPGLVLTTTSTNHGANRLNRQTYLRVIIGNDS